MRIQLTVKSLWGDVIGGSVGALIAIPIILTCGIVLFHSIGPAYVTAGISAALVAAVVTAVVSGLFGGVPLHVNSPKTTHAAILSGLIATMVTHHSFTDICGGDRAPAALMTICFLTLLVSGMTQVLLGASRMGALVKFVPYPVLAGFISGFALQIMLTQVPRLIGLDHESQLLEVLSGTIGIKWWPLGIAVLSGGLMLWSGKFSKLVPSAIIGLLGGILAQILATKYIAPADLGPAIGALPSGVTFSLRVNDILQFVSTTAFSRHTFQILATGITLAFVSSIQSLLSISASDRLFGTPHNSNRELMVQGAGNVLSALFGGAPSGGSPNVTQTVFANGGRSNIANLAYAATLLGLSYWLSSAIALIPLSAMAGVVIVTTAGAMDKWTQQLLVVRIGDRGEVAWRRDLTMNLVVVVLVAALVVVAGALAALGVGMAAVFMVFVYRSNATVIRRVLHADCTRSRTERSQTAIDALNRHGQRIAIIELDGPIFFGTAETVAKCVENVLQSADWIVLDLKRVGHFDSSGVMMLKRMDDRALKSNRHLFLSYLSAGGNRRHFLRSIGLTRPEAEGRIYEDTDTALSRAEDELLIQLECSQDPAGELPLGKFEVCRDMTEDEVKLLGSVMIGHQRSRGELIIRKGENSHNFLFLTQGRVSVLSETQGRTLRLANYRAGVTVGVIGLLSAQPRSANVVAETQVALLEMTTDAFEQLNRAQPLLGAKLMRNIAVELSLRLLNLNKLVRELEA